ncbi:hypothetical protein L211DRAFT_853493 [Terfezia boudieri ATCC MYA-4762]|uniref:Uncharacterized protein n=1 Tax=Terfezia boudieri ATCC MYA-4762 TaxID=1051890 RepID=A0A3N4L896_9PEZI|nr:hypothetical protein L211DRAFT_853493 [Terfezia boudieri ATCC MYA-4762]
MSAQDHHTLEEQQEQSQSERKRIRYTPELKLKLIQLCIQNGDRYIETTPEDDFRSYIRTLFLSFTECIIGNGSTIRRKVADIVISAVTSLLQLHPTQQHNTISTQQHNTISTQQHNTISTQQHNTISTQQHNDLNSIAQYDLNSAAQYDPTQQHDTIQLIEQYDLNMCYCVTPDPLKHWEAAY